MKRTEDLQAKLPAIHNWRTTDEEEIAKRRYRAQTESLRVRNLDPHYPIFSNFAVKSGSGLTYTVEIRSVSQRRFSCNCVDFRINALGTCKHVEATLLYLEARHRRLFRQAQSNGAGRVDVVPDLMAGALRIEGLEGKLPAVLKPVVGKDSLVRIADPEEALAVLQGAGLPDLRISQEVAPWLDARRRAEERRLAFKEYEQKVQSGEWPAHETLVPLYPYQREGMLHLAFNERALLADEMGLGKTIQAIAACALLHRLGKVKRVLVVTPASLKTEWEEQIERFTELPYQLIYGQRGKRLRLYVDAPFFTIVNYEQMIADALDVNQQMQPDIVILDEAQRIKNWSTKTAQAVKRLQSRYAFVLTGTPIENRIDDIHSIMSFLDPSVLGPLFRFNREFYHLDERGRPVGLPKSGSSLHMRIKPFLLRRRKADVETELPDRTDQKYFVALSPSQADRYAAHEVQVARLVAIAKRRPLSQQESDKLQRELAMMRMICDTNFILDQTDRTCPKLGGTGKDPGGVPRQQGCQGDRVFGMGAHAGAGEGTVRTHENRLCLAHRVGAAATAPGRDPAVQEQSGVPRLPEHRFGEHGAEPAERERRGQLRPAVESGAPGTAHRARLAQTPDARRHGDPPGVGEHDRAAHARHPLDQAGACRRHPRHARRSWRDPFPRWQTGVPGPPGTADFSAP